MSNWWDSIEAVSRFNNWMQISIVVFGILTAAALALSIFAANRVSALQDIEKAALRSELDNAKKDAEAAARTASDVAEKQKPRSLSSEARSKLAAILAPFRNTTVDVTAVLGDGESFAFADQLRAVLEQSGWKVDGVNQAVFTGRPVGITLVIGSSQAAPPAAVALQHELKELGYEAPGEVNPNAHKGSISIIVGHKP